MAYWCWGVPPIALQIREGEERDEAHGISPYHPVRRELVLLIVIVGHNAQEGAVGYVDGGVDSHHEQIDAIGIDTLAGLSQVVRVEQQGEDKSERNGAEEDPRTVCTPARLRAVCQRAHERVGDHIEETRHEHQRGSIGKRETKDVGEEQRESDRHDLPRYTTSGGISHGITDLLRQFYFHGFNFRILFHYR